MSNIHSPCSSLFICSAILCWNNKNFTYSFTNFTRCTSTSLHSGFDLHLIFHYENNLQIDENIYQKGFVCSSCERRDFHPLNSHSISKCHAQRTRVQLKDYCHSYFRLKSSCQCLLSEQQIEFPTDWIHAFVSPGKSEINADRYLQINQSASLSIYLFLGLIIFLILSGGIISMIFYSIKMKTRATTTK